MKESTRLRYVIYDRLTIDRPLPLINKVNNIYYSLGENFDQYEFRRQSVDQHQVDSAIEQRVHSLREQHDYLRLWFSGGRDSRLILESFMKYGIKIDEIVVTRRCTRNNVGLYPEYNPLIEIDSSAIGFLNKNKDKLSDSKITIIDIDEEHYVAFFENPKWFTKVSQWFFPLAYLPRQFLEFINPKFNILNTSKPTCELVGSAIPTVYFGDQNNYFGYKNPNKKWNFIFSCSAFNIIGPDIGTIHFEDFLITEENPKLFELHVNSIVDDYERTGQHPDYSKNYRQQERFIRDRSLFFKSWSYDEIQLPKIDIRDFEFPSDDYFWNASQSTRGYYDMINRWHQTPMARSLQLYRDNTDWRLVEQHIKRPFRTKTWTLS
jgi:hypothetical protein